MQTSDLDNWRKEIDTIDERIISLLAQRTDVVKKIGKYKLENRIPLRDEKRFQEILTALSSKAEQYNLPKSFITDLYSTIHEYALAAQNKLK